MKLEFEMKLTPRQVAEAFCDLDDEAQAQFFIEVAAIASDWTGGLGQDWQWWKVGRHLRDCSCATEEARDVVRSMADGIQP